MKRLFRAVQLGANLSIILLTVVVLCLVAFEYLNGRFFENNTKSKVLVQPQGKTVPGNRLSIGGVEWSKYQTTAVLYLSTYCGYCKESIPFYRVLINSKKDNVGVIAVFIEDQKVGKEYLKSNDLLVDQIVTDSLSRIGIAGTPAIVLVDSNGTITDLWYGKLPAEKEREVLAKTSF
jgi:thiol-disulfide isomerase/thioredoxin